MARPNGRGRSERVEDHYRAVADDLIERMRRGTAPWTEAWQPGRQRALPENVLTGRAYRGGNAVWLASRARERGWQDPRWGTFRQVREQGGHVRRGEQGTTIVYWQFERRQRARDGQGRPRLDERGEPLWEVRRLDSPRGYTHTVFNAEQCAGLPQREPAEARARWDPLEAAERVLDQSGATLEHSADNRAYYDLGRDRIVMPFREQFPDGVGYYQTALHELGHWTGHPDRLNRRELLRGMEYGSLSPEYAREELRAEISSLITGNRLGLGHNPDRHAAYVESWAKALREDPREIYRAARDAQAISDWVLERVRERDPERAAASPPPPPQRPLPPPEPGEQYRLFQREAHAPAR